MQWNDQTGVNGEWVNVWMNEWLSENVHSRALLVAYVAWFEHFAQVKGVLGFN